MIFIFRKLRRSFFLPGKVRTYCAYAAGEIVLIVVGILLALQISEWNQARKDRAEETEILVRLKAEFEGNQQLIDKSIDDFAKIESEMKAFLQIIKPEPDLVSEELIHRYVATWDWNPEYLPRQVVLNSLTTSGKINLISNQALSDALFLWPAKLEELNEDHNHLDYNRQQFAGFWATVHPWKSSIKETGVMEDVGLSHFKFDQKAFLSMQVLETAVALTTINSHMYHELLVDLKTLQQSILTLIDAELAERGLGGEE